MTKSDLGPIRTDQDSLIHCWHTGIETKAMTEHKDRYGDLSSNVLSQLLDLTATRDLPTFLQKVLEGLIKTFQAQACAIFFQATPPQSHKVGVIPTPILIHINQWEHAVASQLQSGVWRVLDADKPSISKHAFSGLELVLINTPLLHGTRVTGALSLVLPEDQSLTQSQYETLNYLVQSIGQLGSLIAELSIIQKRYHKLDLIHHTSQILAATLDADKLLETVIELTGNVLDTEATSILLIDEKRQELVFEVCHGPHSNTLRHQRIALDQGIAGWVARNRRPIIINDVNTDNRFNRAIDVQTRFLTRSIAAVPLQLKGEVIGILEAVNKQAEQGFDDDDLQLMISIAAQAAVALENAKLYQSLREERDKIIDAQESERHALSRVLHDGTVQQLSAISMNLEYLQKLIAVNPSAANNEIDKIQALAHKATKEARLVLFELRPIILETEGLVPALKRYVDQLNEDGPMRVEAKLSPLPFKLHTNIAGTIFSIVQEAVNNAKRHAKASSLEVMLSTQEETLLVTVQDNGVGFDLSQVEDGYADRNSFGLLNMRERATLIEGALTIQSSKNGPTPGTKIILIAPLKPGTGPLKNTFSGMRNYE